MRRVVSKTNSAADAITMLVQDASITLVANSRITNANCETDSEERIHNILLDDASSRSGCATFIRLLTHTNLINPL